MVLLSSFVDVFSVYTNHAYAQEEETEDSEDEGDAQGIRTSASDNRNNVLGQNRAQNQQYMSNLKEVLTYNENVHYLTTYAVLSSDLFKGNSNYARIYNGNLVLEADNYTHVDTNTTELYNHLDRMLAERQEEISQVGVTDAMVQSMFGKSRESLSDTERNILSQVETMVNGGKAEVEAQSEAFGDVAVTQMGEYICRTALVSSGYGGVLPVLAHDKNYYSVDVDGVMLTHLVLKSEGARGNSGRPINSNAIGPCVTNLVELYQANPNHDNVDGAVIALENLLVNFDDYSNGYGLSIIKALRTDQALTESISSKYKHSGKNLSSGVSKWDHFLHNMTPKDTLDFLLDYFVLNRKDHKLAEIPPTFVRFGTHETGGLTSIESNYKHASNGPYELTTDMIDVMNSVQGTSYSVSDFKTSFDNYFTLNYTASLDDPPRTNGVINGLNVHNKRAWVDLNRFLSLQLIDGAYYDNNKVSGFNDYKEEMYDAYLSELQMHPYILYLKHVETAGNIDTVTENINGLGWVPIYFVDRTYDTEHDQSITKERAEANTAYDGTALDDTLDFLTYGKGYRPLTVADLVAMEVDGMVSPVAASNDDGTDVMLTTMGPVYNEKYYAHFTGLSFDDISGEASARTKFNTDKPHLAVYQEAFSKPSVLNGAGVGYDGLGIDNYGNIIVGSNLSVVVPYWHTLYTEANVDSVFYATPLYKNDNEASVEGNSYRDVSFAPIRNYDPTQLYAQSSADAIKQAIINNDEAALKRIARTITNETKSVVQSHNEEFIERYEHGASEGQGELYITSASLLGELNDNMSDLMNEFNEADILNKIAMMLKYGAWDFIRLTFVGLFVDFYNTVVYNFTISQIFYMDTIVDSTFFQQLLPPFIMFLGAVAILYTAITALLFFFGRITIKRWIVLMLGLTVMVLVPFIYSWFINLAINDVSEGILGKQTRQMMVVDTWTEQLEQTLSETDTEASRLYGMNNHVEFRDIGQDYIITFYTTTLVENGCDVLNPTTSTCIDFVTDDHGDSLINTWDKRDLVSVRVSLFDIYDWLDEIGGERLDQVAGSGISAGIGSDTNVDGGQEDTSETIGRTDLDLFTYLQARTDAVEKGYSELNEYTEYRIDTTVHIGLGGGLPGITYQGEDISASELLARIFLNSVNEEHTLMHSLDALTLLYLDGITNRDITAEQKGYLVRDLAMTRDARRALNGGDDFSSISKGIIDDFNLNLEVPGLGKSSHSGDMFNLHSSIQYLNPNQKEGTWNVGSTMGDTFKANKRVIDSYFTDFAVVRAAMGGISVDATYRKAESMVLATVIWMQSNNTFDLNLFPVAYDSSTVSLDNYMRLAFVPVGEFSDPTFTHGGEYHYTNVGEYLSLRENMFVLTVFALMIVTMLGYGILRAALLYVGLLVMTLYGIARSYLTINSTVKENKFMTGFIMTYGTLILMNLIFAFMWWAFSYSLNASYAANGAVGYPATLIHSIIAIIILWQFIKQLLKMIHRIRKDPSALGGHEYAHDIAQFNQRLANRFRRGDMRSKDDGSYQSAYDKDLSREGMEGRVAREEVERSNKQGTENLALLGTAGGAAAAGIMGALNGANTLVNSQPGTMSHAFNGIVGSSAATRHLVNTLGRYDSVDTNGNSIIDKSHEQMLQSTGGYGTKLGASGNGGNVHMFSFGESEEGIKQASMVKDYLKKEGYHASSDKTGSKVLLDAGGHDLSAPSGRKVLFDKFLQNVAFNTKHDESTHVTNVNNRDELASNFTYTVDSDGAITVPVGEKSGLHPSVLAHTVNEDWFREQFTVTQAYTGGGDDGEITITPKSDDSDTIDASMSKVFNLDTRGRTREGYGNRKDSQNNKFLKFNGNNNTISNVVHGVVAGAGAAGVGMTLHKGKLVYDSQNAEHNDIVKNVQNKIKETQDGDMKTARTIMSKVGNYVLHGDNNEGESSLVQTERLTEKEKSNTGYMNYSISSAEADVTKLNEKGVTLNTTHPSLNTTNVAHTQKQINATTKALSDSQPETRGNIVVPEDATPTTLDDDFGKPTRIMKSSVNKELLGTGIDHQYISNKTEGNRKMLTKLGIISPEKITHIYGGDGINQRVEEANQTMKLINENDKEFKVLADAKQGITQTFTEHFGNEGSEKRVNSLMQFVNTADINDESVTQLQNNYKKLTRDYQSGNITDDIFNSEMRHLNVGINQLLQDKELYDSAIISALNNLKSEDSSKLSKKDKDNLDKYRKSKNTLIGKGVNQKTLEKFTPEVHREIKQFNTKQALIDIGRDSKTFNVKASQELANEDTKKIMDLLNNVS